MRYFFLLAFGIITNHVLAQNNIIEDTLQQYLIIEMACADELEQKCRYTSLRLEQAMEGVEKEGPFILEIVPTQFEEIEVTFSNEELLNYKKRFDLYTIPISPSHNNIQISGGSGRSVYEREGKIALSPKVLNGYVAHITNRRSEYVTLSKDELKEINNKLITKRIIEPTKLVKWSVVEKPETLKDNEYFFEGGYWTTPRQLILGEGCGGYSIISIQNKLIELGYLLKANNKLDDATKDALRHFQKKHRLKIGQLDFETLKKLDISY